MGAHVGDQKAHKDRTAPQHQETTESTCEEDTWRLDQRALGKSFVRSLAGSTTRKVVGQPSTFIDCGIPGQDCSAGLP